MTFFNNQKIVSALYQTNIQIQTFIIQQHLDFVKYLREKKEFLDEVIFEAKIPNIVCEDVLFFVSWDIKLDILSVWTKQAILRPHLGL